MFKFLKISIIVFIYFFQFVIPSIGRGLNSSSDPSYVQDEVIVHLKPKVSDSEKGRVLSSFRSSRSFKLREKFFVVKLAAGVNVTTAIEKIKKDPTVQWAEPNYIGHVSLSCTIPTAGTDAYFTNANITQNCGSQSSLTTNANWPFTAVNAQLAWQQLSLPCPVANPIIIAVLDTGVASSLTATNHPDLPSSIFIQGYNFLNFSYDSTDDMGHGTFMTGIIAAQWNNSETPMTCSNGTVQTLADGNFNGGLVGMAGYPGLVAIMPIKIADSNGQLTTENAVNGIDYAVIRHAKILNLSFEVPSSVSLQTSVAEAIKSNCILVASSGKQGAGFLDLPAGYDGVIAVGASDKNNQVDSAFSNGGPGLSLMAPGGSSAQNFDPSTEILGCALNCLSMPANYVTRFYVNPCDNNYSTASGNSASAAFVTGTAALMLAANPNLSNSAVSQILATTASDYPSWSTYRGYGLLNASAAVNAAIHFTPAPTFTPTATFTPIPVGGQITNQGTFPTSCQQ